MSHEPYIVIGIDPGERWTGIAMLSISETLSKAYAATAVLNRELMYPAHWLNEMLDRFQKETATQIHVVVEEYRIRPQKYESFASGGTLQLIGALRFVTDLHEDIAGFMLRPAQQLSMDQMKRTSMYTFLKSWRPRWPSSTSRTWEHAISAWRVILHHALTAELEDLRTLSVFQDIGMGQDDARFAPLYSGELFGSSLQDRYVAPTTTWTWGLK